MAESILRLGIDVGSTTVKLVIVEAQSQTILHERYLRHGAWQKACVLKLLKEAEGFYPEARFQAAVCGSGGKGVARAMGISYIQEVVASAQAVQALYPQVRTAIELGGQDAKMIFFHADALGKLLVSDMRMNGSCAGGTGAFIDEVAAMLKVQPEDFEQLAAQGSTVYDISGRCGVFAKADIKPLLLAGVQRADLALSALEAIVKQTIGGLAQGLTIEAPVLFAGGPLSFLPTLVAVFAQRLQLGEADIICPERPEMFVALGAALSAGQLSGQEDSKGLVTLGELIARLEHHLRQPQAQPSPESQPFFASKAEQAQFIARHQAELWPVFEPEPSDGVLRVYLGVDSGSTTSKFVLIDEHERLIERFYAANDGQPLNVVCAGLALVADKYQARQMTLEILGVGTTGYGELLFAQALGADYHTVETVAHALGSVQFFPEADFVLDIGGQDMKAIWLHEGLITDISLNEACSSGCGAFLENFAQTLGISVEQIAAAAFRSASPAVLGSRCTVFMNSTIINEQRNGKKPDDLMAGLCRSIIENVFTKVIRIHNPEQLGQKIIVQGGTFRNLAVLKALEDYLNQEVTLAPYPEEMGALGAALAAKRHLTQQGGETAFIGLEAVRQLTYTVENDVPCPHCANHCSRRMITFSTGKTWVSGNRCQRGAIIGQETDADANRPDDAPMQAVDLFELRAQWLLDDYAYQRVAEDKAQTIGLPCVLEFWDSLPFWQTFFRALGYQTVVSEVRSAKRYEAGLSFVASDTICFPAKVVHSHIMDLADKKADRIFMPYIMHMPPEGPDKLSPYVCSVVMGYPMVVEHAQSPAERYGVIWDAPVFHWFSEKDRQKQICAYAADNSGVTLKEARAAFSYAEQALLTFRKRLTQMGQHVLDSAAQNHQFAVVLAGRPYHTDPLISHHLSKQFTNHGIAVLTVDSLPGLQAVDLHNTGVEITNNYHTRMLAAAMLAAQNPALECVQLVSFGCGHDAVLTDEMTRIMTQCGHKSLLALKIDESEATGSLTLRIQSFLESVRIRRNQTGTLPAGGAILKEPSPVKFTPADRPKRVLLIPNISAEVSKLLSGICAKEGFVVQTVPVGGVAQIKLGKYHVHNDICFPCQMVIGELISALQKGHLKQDEVAVGMVKFQCDCRLSHYAALLRKGLDSAGFNAVPIVTTDVNDTKAMHPGVQLLGLSAVLEAVWTFMMLDILTDLCRKIRPYEQLKGETDRVYQTCVDRIAEAIQVGIPSAKQAFAEGIDALAKLPYDRSRLKPQVLVTGELLVTYHPGSNFDLERYLEQNGLETIFPRVTDQLRKDFLAASAEIKTYHAHIPPYPLLVSRLFDSVQKKLEKIALRHPLYQCALTPRELYQGVSHIMPETLSCGEGWLMAAEIVHYAQQGVKTFVILQPFGCLPNHICGRGVLKRIKADYPDIQILPLDLEPDTSFANVENRLQMLLMSQRQTY